MNETGHEKTINERFDDFSVVVLRVKAERDTLLAACIDALVALEDVYDVDEPEPGHQVETPFSGAGLLMDTLRAAIAKADKVQS